MQVSVSVDARDTAVRSVASPIEVRELSPSQHDYVDVTPRAVSTSGAIGAAFVQLETSVVQVERLAADLPLGTDLVLRTGGQVAQLLGAAVAPVFAGGETLQLIVDADNVVTVAFLSSDTTQALAARRINYALGRPVADLDPVTAQLRLLGFRTGGADAMAKGWGFGRLQVVGGTALSQLALSVGVAYGQGDDQRLGAGPFCKTFPASALPRRIELSGITPGARFITAGKAG